ncbi:NAD(P)/FAD-dependent oxidoreductase [Sutcliffiella halmapala]|uniref:NAD(P)/FAD-dependent oxidoreductase n=1 Tax=Sutcliffiella halmapala TaxID=79882 RepID=UPI00099513AD|nr:FAD-dependent oxidoreductase [Sutcliffiella halmapala]
MDLYEGEIYWHQTIKNPPTYSSLTEDIECDVLIIGAGSSGAQIAYLLKDTELNVVVVDKRKVGQGSTSANTALIQYMGDKSITELVDAFGEETAFRHLKQCEQAIKDMEAISQTLPINPEFTNSNGLYYVSREEDVHKLRSDFDYLKKHGFQVEWLSEKEIGGRFPFEKSAGIYAYNEGEMNPLKYVYGLLEAAKQCGVRVYEQTEVKGKRLDKEGVTIYTTSDYAIRAKSLIVAGGYESIEFKKNENAKIASSFAVVTTPVKDLSAWYEKSMILTAWPYIYMRTTPDNRVIIGGLDEPITDVTQRERIMLEKRKQLIQEFHTLFPNIMVEAEFYLGAAFGGTHDGLPMIGIEKGFPNCYYIYGYGENGTVYNMVLGKVVVDLITTGNSENLDLYLQHDR